MFHALRIIAHMGSLQRLAPLTLVALLVAILGWSWAVPLAIAYGIVAQFVLEYIFHRFVYHREPPVDQPTFNALYRSHIGHHEFPTNPEFFTGDDHWFPVRVAAVSLVLHLLPLWPLVGLAEAAKLAFVALFLGSALAFAFYEYCHTLAHLNVPKGWFGRRLTRSHLAHHLQDHDATFHVSFGMGWIDRLFGTALDPARARAQFDRNTIRSLGMDPEDLRLVTARKAWGLPRDPRRPGDGPVV
ncbi:sterol desaturase family protein [Pseudooceanicola aestuarii]|uniref:sterol desaturase family protein n=1 Tax=Pseudooceanicola aestuarii TaxID=2697319 RepID=UPI0013CFAB9D|nr:sterol desaturase family protein [Pseudooceanicola aestuarii]